MTTQFRPMLATDAVLDKINFPLLASAKLDGIRAVVRDGVVYSRSNKPIPNLYVQQLFKSFTHYDGELIVGEPTSKTCYRDTVSGVMSFDKTPDVRFFVFDHVEQPARPYYQRQALLREDFEGTIVMHEQVQITNSMDLLNYEEDCLAAGYEGLILRDVDAPYKMGRSTVNEGYLLKLKRFVDDEATIIGYEERQHNGNEATTNELGRTKRSSHAAGKTGRGDLGALIVRNTQDVEFNIGTGFTDDERASIWGNREELLGQLIKYKHFPIGVKNAPRHPIWIGFRSKDDLS